MPEGTYELSGSNPGSESKYSGTVLVQRTGDTFQVTWTVNGQQIIGIGIGKSDYLAVSYRSGNTIGLAVYTHSRRLDWHMGAGRRSRARIGDMETRTQYSMTIV